ncbi:MAG TPA: hypothetical protein VGY58_10365, partial [Gemmataceae bacterium]|nr:hypothetical protein [Gemmataceae bacterium]
MKKLPEFSSLLVFLIAALPAWTNDLLIQAAKIYTMAGQPLAPGAVLVSNGKIVQIGPRLTAPAGAKIMDLGSGVLMPGLVDAYSSSGVEGRAAETTREITPDYRVLPAVDWSSRAFHEA